MILPGILASGISGHLAPPSSYESIATSTVGSGGASYIEFTSIPSGFEHLQIRFNSLNSTTTDSRLQINADTGSNYAFHYLGRAGSASVVAGAGTSASYIFLANTSTSSYPLTHIIDILDYKNTNKYKTIRVFSGTDSNSVYSPWIGLMSGLWQNTNAITSLKLYVGSGTLSQYSHAALYGIKGS